VIWKYSVDGTNQIHNTDYIYLLTHLFNNTHDQNMYILQMLLKPCELPMDAEKTLLVLGDK